MPDGPPADGPGPELTDWGELVYVDGAGAHGFRQGVAERLRLSWPERARALEQSVRAAVKIGCLDCGCEHLVPFRCGARTCPTCTRAGAAQIVDRIVGRVDQMARELADVAWDGPGAPRRCGWRIVVLTSPTALAPADRFDPVKLRAEVQRVRRAFPKWWKRTPWGRQRNERVSPGKASGARSKRNRYDTAAVIGLEVAPGGVVHIHAAVYGEFVPQAELQREWSKVLGVALAIVHVSAVKGDTREKIRTALQEALKYVTKGEKGDPRRLDRAAAVETALRHVRRVELYGALRAYGELAEDLTQEDLHAGKQLACTDCGQSGAWGWFRIWDAGRVHANGGFGRLDMHRIETFYRARDPDPGPEVCP